MRESHLPYTNVVSFIMLRNHRSPGNVFEEAHRWVCGPPGVQDGVGLPERWMLGSSSLVRTGRRAMCLRRHTAAGLS